MRSRQFLGEVIGEEYKAKEDADVAGSQRKAGGEEEEGEEGKEENEEDREEDAKCMSKENGVRKRLRSR